MSTDLYTHIIISEKLIFGSKHSRIGNPSSLTP